MPACLQTSLAETVIDRVPALAAARSSQLAARSARRCPPGTSEAISSSTALGRSSRATALAAAPASTLLALGAQTPGQR